MADDIAVEEWIANGYRRYEVLHAKELHKLADFILQKRFDDEVGKKYFITVYCYDRSKYPQEMSAHIKNLPRYGYMPVVNFNLGDNMPFFNIEMNSVKSIDEVEDYFEGFWRHLKSPYYEEWV